jgi:AhpC/TSA family protein
VILPSGSPLYALTDKPALVVFLRSFGCTFCREAIADVAAARAEIEAAGASIVFVHSGTHAEAEAWFSKYGLSGAAQISDPGLDHYAAFGLGRTELLGLFDPQVWVRGASCARSHGFGPQSPTMMRQLPGAFVVQGGGVLASYRHGSPADRPDYLRLVQHGIASVTMSSL